MLAKLPPEDENIGWEQTWLYHDYLAKGQTRDLKEGSQKPISDISDLDSLARGVKITTKFDQWMYRSMILF